MAIKVTETGGNFSTATWYRSEAEQLDLSSTPLILSSNRYATITFANSGNIRGVVLAVGGYTSYASPVGRYAVVGIQKGSTATLPVASPGIVTQTSHGFTGSRSGVTISNGTPAVCTYAGHGLKEGDRVGFTTTGGLPTGVTAGTIYYCRYIDTDTFNISATQKGSLIATSSAGSGTHSMWVEWVQFTTTGALPTGVTANTFYCVKYINANTYNLASTAGGTSINFTGSTSGTHTAWHNKEYSFKTTDEIIGTGLTYFGACCWFIPFLFSGTTAVDTTASGWRFFVSQTDGSGSSFYAYSNSSSAPFYITWCDTTQAWSSGDAPVICAPVTYDTTTQFTGTSRFYHQGLVTHVCSMAGLICAPAAANRAYSSSGAGNVMLGWDGTASRTLTIDGTVWLSAHAGVYVGTEDAPISYANKAIINIVNPVTLSGATAASGGFGDITYGGNYYGGGATLVFSGAYPTQRYATLTSNAVVGQPDLVVDDASGFANNDYVYISKHSNGYSGSNNAARYQISSIASNTITLTANVAGQDRLAGGFVVLTERGYGVQIYCTSLANYCTLFRGHGVSNIYFKGVYGRGLYTVLGYSTSYQFRDNLANYRAGGWYFGYLLCESYQANQLNSASFCYQAFCNEIGGTFENSIGLFCDMCGTWSTATHIVNTGITKKCGPLAASNIILIRNASTAPGFRSAGSGLPRSTYTNIISHNCYVGLQPGQNSTYTNCSSFGCYDGLSMYIGYFFTVDGYTADVVTRNAVATYSSGYNIIGATLRNVSFTNVTGYGWVPTADSYYDLDIDLTGGAGDLSSIDTTYVLDVADGSEIRISNNNGTANDDLVISKNGYRRRCGSGLTDTTVYGSNLYSWRFQPVNQPSAESFQYDQIIGNQQNYDMFVYMWVKINAAAYYAGTHRLPRLYVTYDQTSQSYAQAAESTAWQQLIVPIQPATSYPSITIELNGYTDATGTDSYFYLGQIGIVLPAGRNVDPGALDYWAEAKPLTAIPSGLSAADVWAVPTSQLTGAGTIGKKASSALTLPQFIGLK